MATKPEFNVGSASARLSFDAPIENPGTALENEAWARRRFGIPAGLQVRQIDYTDRNDGPAVRAYFDVEGPAMLIGDLMRSQLPPVTDDEALRTRANEILARHIEYMGWPESGQVYCKTGTAIDSIIDALKGGALSSQLAELREELAKMADKQAEQRGDYLFRGVPDSTLLHAIRSIDAILGKPR